MSDLDDEKDEDLVKELEARGYYVSEWEPEQSDFPCPNCESETMSNEYLESVHYLLAGGKTEEAVSKIKELIYDRIGRIS